jgi:hypothetical protein
VLHPGLWPLLNWPCRLATAPYRGTAVGSQPSLGRTRLGRKACPQASPLPSPNSRHASTLLLAAPDKGRGCNRCAVPQRHPICHIEMAAIRCAAGVHPKHPPAQGPPADRLDGRIGRCELRFPQEHEVLEMLAGLRPRKSETWVNTCLKSLNREGYCTEGPNHRLTDKGRAILGVRLAAE